MRFSSSTGAGSIVIEPGKVRQIVATVRRRWLARVEPRPYHSANVVERQSARRPWMNTSAWALGFSLLLAAYALNALSLLRLNVDGVRYLNIVEYLEGRLGGDSAAATDYLQHGYPWILVSLDKLGVVSSASVIALNVLALGGALVFFVRWTDMPGARRAAALLTLLSWVTIKHVTLPLSDTVFTALAVFILPSCDRLARRRSIAAAVLVLVAFGLSLWLRTAAIAFIAGAVLYLFLILWRQGVDRWGLRRVALAVAATAVAFAGAIAWLARSSIGAYLGQLRAGRLSVPDKLVTAGEVALNLPASRLGVGSSQLLGTVFAVAGACFLLTACWGLYAREGKWQPSTLGVLSYVAMILVWPFYDARFWLPVLPFLFLGLLEGVRMMLRASTPGRIYAVCFAAPGILALAVSTRLSLCDRCFVQAYGNDAAMRQVYREYLECRVRDDCLRSADTSEQGSGRLLYLLVRFDEPHR